MGVISDALDAQGALQPGTEGWWQVYGARAQDVRPGDMIMMQSSDQPEPVEFQVQDYAPRDAPGKDLRDVVRPRFLATDGTHRHIGALQPIVVLRRGTRHTLADSI